MQRAPFCDTGLHAVWTHCYYQQCCFDYQEGAYRALLVGEQDGRQIVCIPVLTVVLAQREAFSNAADAAATAASCTIAVAVGRCVCC